HRPCGRCRNSSGAGATGCAFAASTLASNSAASAPNVKAPVTWPVLLDRVADVCGIAGIVQFDGRPVDEGELRRFTDQMAHRGPDGAGYRLFGHAGLGHRRLAIIDLATGAQPLANEDGTVWVSFNGEIYNYRELQRELETLGHQFRTASDTEVIVH